MYIRKFRVCHVCSKMHAPTTKDANEITMQNTIQNQVSERVEFYNLFDTTHNRSL